MKSALTFSLALLSFHLQAQNWQTLNLPVSNDIQSSSFINNMEGWIGFENANASATLCHTTDGGITWNTVAVPGAATGTSYVDFANAMTGYVVISGAAFKTVDGGNNWTQLSLPGTPAFHPCFLNADTGFIISAAPYTIYKTIDGGSSWLTCNTDFGNFYQIKFYNDSIGAATEYDGYIYETLDAGLTWSIVNDGGLWSYFYGACFSADGKLYYTGYTDFLSDHSTEIYGGPFIYSNTSIGDLKDIRFFSANRGYAAGVAGQIVTTENGGLTWDDYHLALVNLNVIDGFQDMYVFGNNGQGFKLPYYCTVVPIFSFSPADLTITFTDASLNAVSWSWDFGDGTSSTDQNPVHTFPATGDYTVCLTITSNGCGSFTLCQDISVCAANSSLSIDGALDVSFGNNGIATDSAFAPQDKITSLAVQPDGKIIASGSSNNPVIARYDTNGTPDSSFAGDGVTDPIQFLAGPTESFQTVLLSDGKIIMGGIYDQNFTQLLRFLPDGSLDSSYGINGSIVVDLSQENAHNEFVSMALQADDKLLVYGTYYSLEIVVARFNTDGSLDSSFSANGIAEISGFNIYGKYGEVLLQSDGKILLCGISAESDEKFSLIRLNENGTIDSTFGNAGLVITNMSSGTNDYDIPNSLLEEPGGKIIATGTAKSFSSNESYAAARYNADGTLDSSFGSGGKVTFQIEGARSHASDAAIQPDGKVIIAGYFGENPDQRIGLVRLKQNGSIDSAFGTNGIVITHANCDITLAFSMKLDENKIYVGGSNYYNGPFLLAKYLNDCQPPLPAFSYAVSDLTATFASQTQFAASWFWDFGDGIASTDQNPLHAYNLPGSYTVCLVATNDCSADTTCQTISIVATPVNPLITGNSHFSIFPNPVSSAATLEFSFTENTDATIEWLDLQGRKIKTIASGNFEAGEHHIILQKENIPAGLYLLQLKTAQGIAVQKIIIQ